MARAQPALSDVLSCFLVSVGNIRMYLNYLISCTGHSLTGHYAVLVSSQSCCTLASRRTEQHSHLVQGKLVQGKLWRGKDARSTFFALRCLCHSHWESRANKKVEVRGCCCVSNGVYVGLSYATQIINI